MLGDLDLSLPLPESEVYVAKSDGTILGKLENRSTISFSRFGNKKKLIGHSQYFRMNSVNELNFSIPFMVEIHDDLVRNPLIDSVIIGTYLKVVFNNTVEWYVISEIDNTMDNQKDIKQVKSFSLGYELNYRQIRDYKVMTANLSSVLNGGSFVDDKGITVNYLGILNSTGWTLNPSYDVTFDLMYRKIEISQSTVLNAVILLAKIFNAIIQWDTVNRTINFVQLSSVGSNKGLKIDYKTYMKSLQHTIKGDELVNRFRPVGANGIDISSVSLAGGGTLDDFTYHMKGFKRDPTTKAVITSSPLFSDSLCGAILDFQSLSASYQGQYATLQSNLTSYQTQLTTKTNEMTALVTTMKGIRANLDKAQTTGDTANTTVYLNQQSSQQTLINTKQSEINAVNANITSTNNSITTLQANLSYSTNFNSTQLSEMNKAVREKVWVDSSITDPQALYNQALIEFPKYKNPSVTVRIDIVNFLTTLDEQRQWGKLNLGDTIQITYDVIGTNVLARILEISFDHSEQNVTLTISNIENLLSNDEKIDQLLYQSVNSSSNISVNSANWNQITKVQSSVNDLYNNGIYAAKLNILSGVNNTVLNNERGLTISSSVDQLRFIRANNATIALTKDGGNTISVAITPDGIAAPYVIGQLLCGVNLTIANQAGNFSVNGSGATISDMTLSVTRTDGKSRILLDPTNGIKIQAKPSTTFVDRFSADANGNISITGDINATSGSFSGSITANGTITGGSFVSSSLSSATLTGGSINIGSGVFTVNSSGGLTATSASITGSINSGSSITGASFSGGSISIGGSNFTVNSSGILTCNGATVNGTINATSGTLGNLTVNGTLSGGTISGASISGGTVIGSTIKTAASGTRVELTSGYADINTYNGAVNIFRVYNNADNTVTVGNPSGYNISFGGWGSAVYALGNWNFSGTVTGVTATLG